MAFRVRVPGLARQTQRQHVHEFACEELARHVVRAPRTLGAPTRPFDVRLRQRHRPVPHAQLLILLGELRELTHRLLNDRRPRRQSLNPSHGLVLRRTRVHARHEVSHRHRYDAGFTQGRKNLLNVAQEQTRRPHQEDTRAFQALAVRIQQVGDAVQCDRSLAGAWAALDDQEAFVGGADDAVLLRLDGGDDVAHAAVARLAQGMHESALALQFQALGTRGVEEFVLQGSHAPVSGRNVAPTHDAVWFGRRRLIERARGWGAPVHEQGSAVLTRQR